MSSLRIEVAASQHKDLERTMLITLQAASAQVLKSNTIIELSKQDDDYNHSIGISDEQFIKGDLA